MADATWGASMRAQPRQASGWKSPTTQNPYVHPAHGGPAQSHEPYGDEMMPVTGGMDAPEGEGAEAPARFSRIVNGFGAVLSLGLIAGLGIWGYQLAVRDVTGVPVVRAMEGPMRIQPEDPGGVAAAHQGFAVNSIAAEGQAEGPAEQVVLAPAPVELAAEDLPAQSAVEVSATPEAEAGEAVAELTAEAQTAEPMPTALNTGEEPNPMADALAMVDALAAAAEPLKGGEADLSMNPDSEAVLVAANSAAAAVAAVVAEEAEAAPAPAIDGLTVSFRPAPRPEAMEAPAGDTETPVAMASASGVREISAAEVPVGTKLVQLGAFDSEEVARAEWGRIAAQFSDLLAGKDRVIEKAQSGGKTFYRLRAMGFGDLSDARRFCAALMAGDAACIPVVTR